MGAGNQSGDVPQAALEIETPDGDPTPEEYRRKVTREAFVTRLFLVLGIAAAALVIILELIIVIQIRQTQQTGSPVLQAVASNLEQTQQAAEQAKRAARAAVANQAQLKDCVLPRGKCFKAGQARTAKAVVGINEGTLRVIVAALNCQGEGFTGDALARCTVRESKP